MKWTNHGYDMFYRCVVRRNLQVFEAQNQAFSRYILYKIVTRMGVPGLSSLPPPLNKAYRGGIWLKVTGIESSLARH